MKSIAILTFALMTIVGATDTNAQANITGAMGMVYCLMSTLLPFIGFVLMVLAAAAYGFGQFFGADTRSKATTWGMACLTGAIVMILIYMIGPMIITALVPGSSASALQQAGNCVPA